jgi:hypothetical protein
MLPYLHERNTKNFCVISASLWQCIPWSEIGVLSWVLEKFECAAGKKRLRTIELNNNVFYLLLGYVVIRGTEKCGNTSKNNYKKIKCVLMSIVLNREMHNKQCSDALSQTKWWHVNVTPKTTRKQKNQECLANAQQ